MTKKISNRASMMAPLFPQYDQEEEARLKKESRGSRGEKFPMKNKPNKKKSSPTLPALGNGNSPKQKPSTKHKSQKTSSQKTGLPSRSKVKKSSTEITAVKAEDVSATKNEKKLRTDQDDGMMTSCEPFRGEAVLDYCLTSNWDGKPVENATNHKSPQESVSVCDEHSHHLLARPFDIPEDALPPPRPDPFLTVRPSLQLHNKLIAQAKDEGISVETLALEMLAEGVVLRAWEIIERKGAMRGNGAYNSSGSGNHYPQRSQWNQRNFDQQNSRHGSHQGEPNYNSFHYQGASTSRDTSGYQGAGYTSQRPYRPRNNNQAWKEDQSAFLEYVRNQEKRGRR
jgi:hypothetical protein